MTTDSERLAVQLAETVVNELSQIKGGMITEIIQVKDRLTKMEATMEILAENRAEIKELKETHTRDMNEMKTRVQRHGIYLAVGIFVMTAVVGSAIAAGTKVIAERVLQIPVQRIQP